MPVEEKSYVEAVRAATPAEGVLSQLDNVINELAFAVTGVEDRLVSVLAGSEPTPPVACGEDIPGSSDLVRTVGNHVDTISQIALRIRRLTARLEV